MEIPLAAGTYFAYALDPQGCLPEIYDDRPCGVFGCRPLAGTPIVVAADLHAGGLLRAADVEQRVAEIVALEPDLVLLPGDIVDHPPERMIPSRRFWVRRGAQP